MVIESVIEKRRYTILKDTISYISTILVKINNRKI